MVGVCWLLLLAVAGRCALRTAHCSRLTARAGPRAALSPAPRPRRHPPKAPQPQPRGDPSTGTIRPSRPYCLLPTPVPPRGPSPPPDPGAAASGNRLPGSGTQLPSPLPPPARCPKSKSDATLAGGSPSATCCFKSALDTRPAPAPGVWHSRVHGCISPRAACWPRSPALRTAR